MKRCFIYCFLLAFILCPLFANTKTQNKGDFKIYYRQINLNHMSPYFDYEGRYKIPAQLAKGVNHFCFTYKNNKLVSIQEIGTHYSWLIHPLLLIGANKIEYSYSAGKRIAKYYDANGKPTPNYKGIYVEETLYNKNGRKTGLKYFDYKGKPMQGIWNISEYHWQYNDSLVIETRKDLQGDSVDVSPYFPFRISGFEIDPVKHTVVQYNLDKNLHVINSSQGIAYYRDKENDRKDQLFWDYYDAKGMKIHPYGYNKGENIFDKNGYLCRINFCIGNDIPGYDIFIYNKNGNVVSYKSVWNGTEQKVATGDNIIDVKVAGEVKPAFIDTVSHAIKIYVPKGSDISYIKPHIRISQGAVVHPASDIPVDFSNGAVKYEVIAQNTVFSKTWNIEVMNR